MSLINQALKLEQQRRHAPNFPHPPMVTRLSTQRQGSGRWGMILLGLTGMGALLAVSITAILYFGAGYLEPGEKTLASAEGASDQRSVSASQQNPSASPAPTQPASEGVEGLLNSLSPEQLTTVQKMLLEKEQATASSDIPQANKPEAPRSAPDLKQLSKIQEVVDGFTVQGIRKAGQDSRVFLNGKIQRIGDLVDIEHGLVLAGFTDSALVFRTPSGHAFQKSL